MTPDQSRDGRTWFTLLLIRGGCVVLVALLAGCASDGDKAETAKDVAETLQNPASGRATSEKSEVKTTTALAMGTAGGGTSIAAPTEARKDGQITTTGLLMTGMMLGGASPQQLAYAQNLMDTDESLKSISRQMASVLEKWEEEGGDTSERATLLVELRASYEARFDALAKHSESGFSKPADLSQLRMLAVQNTIGAYAIGTELKPMTPAEAEAARAAHVAQWQAIAKIAAEDEGIVDGGTRMLFDADGVPLPVPVPGGN